jgi:hypothetical protein
MFQSSSLLVSLHCFSLVLFVLVDYETVLCTVGWHEVREIKVLAR